MKAPQVSLLQLPIEDMHMHAHTHAYRIYNVCPISFQPLIILEHCYTVIVIIVMTSPTSHFQPVYQCRYISFPTPNTHTHSYTNTHTGQARLTCWMYWFSGLLVTTLRRRCSTWTSKRKIKPSPTKECIVSAWVYICMQCSTTILCSCVYIYTHHP